MKELEKLLTVHQDVASHLCKRSSEDQAYDVSERSHVIWQGRLNCPSQSARELTAATLGQELAIALKQVNMWILNPGDDKPSQILDHKKLLSFGLKLKNALRDVWKAHATDVFDIGFVVCLFKSFTPSIRFVYSSQEEVARIDRLAEQIGTVQALKNSFPPILNVILLALDAPPVFMRTKALRALGQIVTSDSSILSTVRSDSYD
jgi:cohesin loading factor subunit SCC2